MEFEEIFPYQKRRQVFSFFLGIWFPIFSPDVCIIRRKSKLSNYVIKPQYDKLTFCYIRLTKTQISLHIVHHAYWKCLLSVHKEYRELYLLLATDMSFVKECYGFATWLNHLAAFNVIVDGLQNPTLWNQNTPNKTCLMKIRTVITLPNFSYIFYMLVNIVVYDTLESMHNWNQFINYLVPWDA